MKNTEQKEKFIELRAAGRSYQDIAGILKVSKPTLIAWGKELQNDILNARTLRLDELFEKYLIAKTKRVEAFGKRLESILQELNKRTLADVPTVALLGLALKYGENLRDEYEPLRLNGDEEEFDFSTVVLDRPTWMI